jgi:hypothetical protein
VENADTEEVTLDIEVEAEPEPAKVEIDQAAEAFARLEGEMALMRRAVQHLAAERADIVIPDYGPTLTEMTKRLGAIAGSIGAIAEHPAMQVTPDGFGKRIEAAAQAARRDDQGRINDAHNELRQAAQGMRGVTSHARTSAEQRRKLFQTAGGGVLGGILIWSFLPGTIARAMPESWQWPERMARHVLGDQTITDADIRLIRSQNPKAWDEIAEAAALLEVNRAAIRRCRELAQRSKGQVQCTVHVRG